jgi:dihydropteroate synthase
MGIVNVTPDSFSGDGRLNADPLAHARAQAEAGADIIDLGAESTRPGGRSLSSDEEWARLEPVLQALVREPWRPRVTLSVDTRHAQTARRALALGVEVINDVTGLRDPAMTQVLAGTRGDVVVMHALTVPVDPAQVLPAHADVLACVLQWRDEVMSRARASGIAADRLVFDPGIGFGKTAVQSLTLIHEAGRLVGAGGRWLFGHSRKSFLTLFTGAPASDRDDLTLAISAQLAHAGVQVLRVHEVRRHVELLERICPSTPPLPAAIHPAAAPGPGR